MNINDSNVREGGHGARQEERMQPRGSSNPPEKLGYVLDQQEIECLVKKAEKQSLTIKKSDVSAGMEFLNGILCKLCFEIPTDSMYECSKCEDIICDGCIRERKLDQDNPTPCPLCHAEFQKKPINRKVKDIGLNAIRVRHICPVEQQQCTETERNLNFVL